jgi:hypothetical protein
LEDPKLAEQGIVIPIIRIVCPVKFKFSDGFTDFHSAIVDTGAPLSLIPQQIWQHCELRILGKSTLRGVVPKKGCQLPAAIGELDCFIQDENGAVQKATIISYLPTTDRVPIILGFETLLRTSRIVIDCEGEAAFLERKIADETGL